VSAVAFSPDGKRLATAGSDDAVRLWDVATGKRELPGPGHAEPVQCVAFTPDGKGLISGDGLTVRLWDPARAVQLRQWETGPDKAEPLAVAPDGKTFAFCDARRAIRVREMAGDKDVWSVERVGFGVQSLAFSPDGRVLASADMYAAVRVRDAATGKELLQLPAQLKRYERENRVAFSPDGKLLACAAHARGIQVWDWRGGKLVRQVVEQEPFLWCVAFSPDGKYLAAGEARRQLRLWNLDTGKEHLRLEGAETEVQSAVFSPDGRLLATTSRIDRSVRLWEVASGQPVLRLRGHDGFVESVAFSPDGLRLASGSRDTSVLVWDLACHPAGEAARAGIAELWDRLEGADAAAAYRAVCGLSGRAGEAVPFLRTKLRPVPAVTPQRLEALIGELDADEFATRTRAVEELSDLGEAAEAALRAALLRQPPLEVRRRMEGLLERLERSVPAADLLRELRALAVLERAGTAEARALLAELARGNPGARLTREAKASLERLTKAAGR
jgi:WD40 repeat protein